MDSFWSWAYKHAKSLVALGALFTALQTLATFAKKWEGLPVRYRIYAPAAFFAFQATMLVVCLVWTGIGPLRVQMRKAPPENVQKTEEFFFWLWLGLILLWVFFYVGKSFEQGAACRAASHIYGAASKTTAPPGSHPTIFGEEFQKLVEAQRPVGGKLALRTVDRLATLAFVLLYLVISGRFYERTRFRLASLLSFGFWVTLTIADFVFALGASQQGVAWISTLSAAFASVAICLFVGRLDSRLLPSGVMLLPLMYLYGALQVMFEVVPTLGDTFRSAMYVLALLLKAILFLYISWLLRDGYLAKYMGRLERLASRGKMTPKPPEPEETEAVLNPVPTVVRRIIYRRWPSINAPRPGGA